MANINYGFTLAGTTGNQTLDLIKDGAGGGYADGQVISTISATLGNGSQSGSWEDLTVDCEAIGQVKLRITDGLAIKESASYTMLCDCQCTTWDFLGNASGGDITYQDCSDDPITQSLAGSGTVSYCVNNGTTPILTGDVTGVNTSTVCP